jgi:hypothetical protein
MDDETDVRALLTAVQAPPSRVDLDTVLIDGDRRIRRRWVLTIAGSTAVVLVALVGVPAAIATIRGPQPSRPFADSASAGLSDAPNLPSKGAPPSPSTAPPATTKICAAHPLPLPAGVTGAKAEAVDPTGRYIGGQTTGKKTRGVLWTDGVPTILPIAEDWVEISGINEHGVVVGMAMDNAGKIEYVFRYANGKATKLKNVPGYPHAFPVPAINAAGDIVINAETKGSVEGADSIAMIWKAGTITAQRLPTRVTDNVYAITDDGTVVGGHYGSDGADSAAAWSQSGHETRLDRPAGTRTVAYAARGDWAAGGAWSTTQGSNALSGTPLWNLRTGAVKLVPGGIANAINASGLVLSENSQLYQDGAPPRQLAAPASGYRNFASGVADTGLVVGSLDANCGSKPTTWSC